MYENGGVVVFFECSTQSELFQATCYRRRSIQRLVELLWRISTRPTRRFLTVTDWNTRATIVSALTVPFTTPLG